MPSNVLSNDLTPEIEVSEGHNQVARAIVGFFGTVLKKAVSVKVTAEFDIKPLVEAMKQENS